MFETMFERQCLRDSHHEATALVASHRLRCCIGVRASRAADPLQISERVQTCHAHSRSQRVILFM
jgi:hypothetical protein